MDLEWLKRNLEEGVMEAVITFQQLARDAEKPHHRLHAAQRLVEMRRTLGPWLAPITEEEQLARELALVLVRKFRDDPALLARYRAARQQARAGRPPEKSPPALDT